MNAVEALQWMKDHPFKLISCECPPFDFRWVEEDTIRAACRNDDCECINDDVWDEEDFVTEFLEDGAGVQANFIVPEYSE